MKSSPEYTGHQTRSNPVEVLDAPIGVTIDTPALATGALAGTIGNRAHEQTLVRGTLGNHIVQDPGVIERARDHFQIPQTVESLIVIDGVDPTRIAQSDDRLANEFRNEQRAYQERVFGQTDLSVLKADALARLEGPVEQRIGEPLVINGREKRPIMDIGLSEDARIETAKRIDQRDKALDHTIQQFTEMVQNGEKVSGAKCHELLSDTGVWGRNHGNLLGKRAGEYGHNPGATVADLYVDDSDLAKFDQLDALIGQLLPTNDTSTFSGREMMSNAILQLAGNSFPSGVELVHAIDVATTEDLVDHGNLAPRSQRKHGHYVQNSSLNGAFIHMTGPGGAATEYGDKLLAGIPIETIVTHSPYMQLEANYTGNEISRKDKEGNTVIASTQYKMGEVRINSLQNAPEAFRAALQQMSANISGGLKKVGIGQGRYDNVSFAASNTAESASAYVYPLKEMSLYTVSDAFDTLYAAAQTPEQRELLESITTVILPGNGDTVRQLQEHVTAATPSSAVLLNAAPLPNFDPQAPDGLTLFSPISAEEVPFTESTAGNDSRRRALKHTLETVKANAIPRYLDGLYNDGLSVEEALMAGIESVNSKGGQFSDLVLSYNGGRAVFDQAGIHPAEIFGQINDETMRSQEVASTIAHMKEATPPDPQQFSDDYRKILESWASRGEYASRGDKAELLKAYGDRLFSADPALFTQNAYIFEEYGYQLTPDQQATIDRYEQQRREEEAKTLASSSPAFHF